MTVIYTSLSYEDYKGLEAQMRKFAETIHTSTGGFYHKSLRLRIGKELTIEFHGPIVKAAESLHHAEATQEPLPAYPTCETCGAALKLGIFFLDSKRLCRECAIRKADELEAAGKTPRQLPGKEETYYDD